MIPEMAILASLPAYPPPLYDARDYLSSSLHYIGGEGSDTAHEDTGTQTASATDGGVASSSEVRTTLDATINGSDVKVVADRDVHVTATDSKTGDPLLDQHIRYQVTAELDVCPSAAGIVLASSGHAYTAESSTFAGAGGRVGSHNTASLTTSSTFKGQVDDQANLGNVAQDANVDGNFHRTSAAPGGPEASHEGTYTTSVTGINDGVPTSHDWSITGSDWSGIESGIGSVKVDRTGDATVDQIGDAAGSAAVDWATIDSSFVEAQKLWRDTRCVIVTAPTYIPLSAYAHNARPTHTEEVGKGSTTEFEVGTGHRFDQKVTALIKATLDGKESLEPKEVPKPPGTLTYVASDEDDQTAIVDLISTSKQGIGRQRLLFHTSDEKLKVSITGKMTTSALGVSYTTTVSVPEILLTKQSDGSFLGSAPVTTRIHLNGDIPCPAPFKEQGGTLFAPGDPSSRRGPEHAQSVDDHLRQDQQAHRDGELPRDQPRQHAPARHERGDRRVHVRARRCPDPGRGRLGDRPEDRARRREPERHRRDREGPGHQGQSARRSDRLRADRRDESPQAPARTSRSFAANESGSPAWPYSPPRKPPWSLGKTTGARAEPLGDGLRPTVRHLAFRLRAGGQHDPGRGRPQRLEVGLVVRAGDDVLTQQRVGPGAVVLGRQPEHRRDRAPAARRIPRSSVPCGSRRR